MKTVERGNKIPFIASRGNLTKPRSVKGKGERVKSILRLGGITKPLLGAHGLRCFCKSGKGKRKSPSERNEHRSSPGETNRILTLLLKGGVMV